jgi:SAM-dependent methyltransferase
LEHLEEPEQAIRECFRVLKAGAHAIYTVPLIWHLHEEPRDFFRYTKYGLQHLFLKAGFEIVEITPMSGFWVTFGQLSSYMLHRRNRRWLRRTKVIPPLGGLIQLAALALDRLDHAEQWTWAYLAVVRKPQAKVTE